MGLAVMRAALTVPVDMVLGVVMSASHHTSGSAFSDRGVMFWLPPGGFGNGVPAVAWAEIADLTEEQLASVLFDLAEAEIGGYVARPTTGRIGQHGQKYRLWVDTRQYSRASDLLMRLFKRFDQKES